MKPSLGFYSPLVLGRRLPRQPHPPHHTASGFVCVELAVKTIVGLGLFGLKYVTAETIWGDVLRLWVLLRVGRLKTVIGFMGLIRMIRKMSFHGV
ncbi:hypothetical protein C1H46_042469 [Malus baccata]|uniref:Uncharacterized protein n=1 Tax=Malus baccata TaxID=106549 RepID=A0A540KD13_MALBA|nr:hypothetical protein C1H46_042469 [Malus baccata]